MSGDSGALLAIAIMFFRRLTSSSTRKVLQQARNSQAAADTTGILNVLIEKGLKTKTTGWWSFAGGATTYGLMDGCCLPRPDLVRRQL